MEILLDSKISALFITVRPQDLNNSNILLYASDCS